MCVKPSQDPCVFRCECCGSRCQQCQKRARCQQRTLAVVLLGQGSWRLSTRSGFDIRLMGRPNATLPAVHEKAPTHSCVLTAINAVTDLRSLLSPHLLHKWYVE